MIDPKKPIEWIEKSDIAARHPPVVAKVFDDGSAVIYWKYKQSSQHGSTVVPANYPYIRNGPEKPAEHWVAKYTDGTFGLCMFRSEAGCLRECERADRFLRAVLFREVT